MGEQNSMDLQEEGRIMITILKHELETIKTTTLYWNTIKTLKKELKNKIKLSSKK